MEETPGVTVSEQLLAFPVDDADGGRKLERRKRALILLAVIASAAGLFCGLFFGLTTNGRGGGGGGSKVKVAFVGEAF